MFYKNAFRFTGTSGCIDNICKMGGIGRDTFLKMAIENYVNVLATSYAETLNKIIMEEEDKEKGG